MLDGVVIKPTLALGGWLAFKSMGTDATVMGDLVWAEDEINPVMAKLLSRGITAMAVHARGETGRTRSMWPRADRYVLAGECNVKRCRQTGTAVAW